MEARYLTLTLAGEEQRLWRPVIHMKMDSYQLDLPKILYIFLMTFQGKFQISCVVRKFFKLFSNGAVSRGPWPTE